MKVSRLVFQEISHRRLNFLLAVVSVAVAIACLVGAITLLKAGEIQTSQKLKDKEQVLDQQLSDKEVSLDLALKQQEEEVSQAGKKLQDAMRKITKGLGFNILVLAEDENLGEFHAQGTPTRSMPQEYVTRLANSKIVVINHLLPIVTKKITWPETGQTIILTGTRGEVPLAHRDPKKPLLDLVPKGHVVLGHHLHTSQKLKTGGTVQLLGKTFQIDKCHPERGSQDDVTAWINLGEAQEMLKMQNLVNAILALECNCATVDRIAEIRKEIASILPGTKVIERGKPALARAEARNRAKKEADAALKRAKATKKETLAQERQANQQTLEQEQQAAAGLMNDRYLLTQVLVPVAMVGSFVWIALLALGNARQRRGEIGILRAIGLRSKQVLTLFLGKALLVGVAGAILGYIAGFLIGTSDGSGTPVGDLFDPVWLIATALLAPLLSAAASWIPALLAARQDPALVLQEE